MLQRLVLFLAALIPSVPTYNGAVCLLPLQVKRLCGDGLLVLLSPLSSWCSHKQNLILHRSPHPAKCSGSTTGLLRFQPMRPLTGSLPLLLCTDGLLSLPAPPILFASLSTLHSLLGGLDIMQRGRAAARHETAAFSVKRKTLWASAANMPLDQIQGKAAYESPESLLLAGCTSFSQRVAFTFGHRGSVALCNVLSCPA